MEENQSCRCLGQPSESKGCQHHCWFVFLESLRKEILDCKREIKELIYRKIPDPPVILVSSKEVCEYAAIAPKTLYRCEKKNMISYHSRTSKGKLYRYEDMVKLKKIYHNLSD
ncbi:hypothetical protein [Sphingobacterium kitahiroshimense]|uniref:hypothetical protein n=1 Tax=Sphingobacterium kitahiroshimense TaxID=470446 RepID=UPI003208134F